MNGFGGLVDLDAGLKPKKKPDEVLGSLRKPALTLKQLQAHAEARGDAPTPLAPAIVPDKDEVDRANREKIIAAFGTSGNMTLPSSAQQASQGETPSVPPQFLTKPLGRPLTVTEAFGECPSVPLRPQATSPRLLQKTPAHAQQQGSVPVPMPGMTMTISDAFGSCQNRPLSMPPQGQAPTR